MSINFSKYLKERSSKMLSTTGLISLMAFTSVFQSTISSNAQEANGEKSATSEAAITEMDEVFVVGRFISKNAISGLKTNVALRDAPMTISSYSGAFMESIETSNISDLYNYMVGVQRAGTTGYDISIRGFTAGSGDRNSIQVDGLPGLGVRFGSPPTISAERIEVVKGPASVLYGQVQPGGFINIVTKKPQEEQSFLVKVRTTGFYGGGTSIGDALGATVGFDATGPMNDSGTFLYRVVGEYQNTNSWRNEVDAKSYYFMPSVTWNASEDTQATFSLEYRKEEVELDNALVAPFNDITLVADLKTRYQEDDDEIPEEGLTLGLTIKHTINENVTWNTSMRSVFHKDTRTGRENNAIRYNIDDVAVALDQLTLRRRARDQINKRSYNFIDTNVIWDIESDFISHKIMVGFNGGREIANFERLDHNNDIDILDVNIYNPILGAIEDVPDKPGSHPFTTNDSIAGYIQDQISFGEHWKAVTALRYEYFKSNLEDRRAHIAPEDLKADQETSGGTFLPMLGLIYQPSDSLSFYTSYATSFKPPRPDRVDVDGNRDFDPETGWQVEGGVKINALDNNLVATISLFHIQKKDVLNKVASGIYQNFGGERSRGAEIEVNARVNENLQIIAGYAYVDAILSDNFNDVAVGQTLRNAPKHTASMWARYDFLEGPLEGLGLGLGISHASHRFGTVPGITTKENSLDRNGLIRLELPAYTIVDFGIYYEVDGYNATLKFSNLFDKLYYESATHNKRVQPGAPASVTFSISKLF